MITLGKYKQTKNCNGPLQVEHGEMEISDADTMCDCGEQPQTMNHLLKCPFLSPEYTTEDLMEYNEVAKECVFQWMNNV